MPFITSAAFCTTGAPPNPSGKAAVLLRRFQIAYSGVNIPSLSQGTVNRDARTASLAALARDKNVAKTGNNAVALRKILRLRFRAG